MFKGVTRMSVVILKDKNVGERFYQSYRVLTK